MADSSCASCGQTIGVALRLEEMTRNFEELRAAATAKLEEMTRRFEAAREAANLEMIARAQSFMRAGAVVSVRREAPAQWVVVVVGIADFEARAEDIAIAIGRAWSTTRDQLKKHLPILIEDRATLERAFDLR